jgi:hypothetical protein
MFGSLNKYKPPASDATGIFSGELHLFTDFNPESRWFNISERAEASDSEIKTISLPKNLRPDHKAVPYIFFSQHHCLVYDAGELAPSSAQKLVEFILSSPKIAGDKVVSVTAEPAKGTVASLLSRPKLREVHITLKRPNPDDLSSLEARIQDRLRKMNAATKTEEYKSIRGQTLKPDEELKQVARVAGSNGEVAVKHVDANGNTVMESTREHPKQLFGVVDPDTSTAFDALCQLGFEHLEER